MINLTLRQLKVFEAVARHHSYTRAAQELNLTQPAVYLQVRNLEQTLGLPLTEQVGKKAYLTDAGKEVLHSGGVIDAQLKELERTLEQMKGVEGGQLRIAVTSTANAFATDLLARFRARHPHITIQLDIANRRAVLKQLEANSIDLAIMGEPPEGQDLTALPFHDNSLIVIAPADHPLASRENIPVAELADETFLVREQGSGTREATERYFASHGLVLKTGLTMNSNEAIKQGVKVGMGLAVVARHSVMLKLETRRLMQLSVEGFPLQRHWHIVHRNGKRLSPTPQAFKDFLLEKHFVEVPDRFEEQV